MKSTKNRAAAFFLLTITCLSLFINKAKAQVDTAKPWTFWWWMGNAVNNADIKKSLEQFKSAGIGGVHIIPIYGVKGYEKQFEPFLGDQWMKSLEYTLAEAKRLNIGVDLTAGTGWPFGGPNVSQDMSAKIWKFNNGSFSAASTMQKVKRAAPGGQGYVLDPFDKDLMRKYLMRFDSAFKNKNLSLRATYCDSYEVYGANWTNNFLEEFKKRRGYDLQSASKVFLDTTRNPLTRLVKIDYQQTLSELLYDASQAWTTWSAQHHYATRYQAHGSPGNILDLYSLATIPETEAFGSSNFSIPNLRVDPDYEGALRGRPNSLMMKFASSEAGVAGKKLVSSETCTWLANHFHVSLSQAKPQIDELLCAGINHIVFHGTTYSPQAEQYPGWLFYASTNFGPTSHFYAEMPLFTKYIYNCQHILQNSKPDNDVLVYFPIQDIWADQVNTPTGIQQLDVHHYDAWFMGHTMGKVCKDLADKGFAFDYISDKQLVGNIHVVNGKLQAANSLYKVLVVPYTSFIPKATMDRLEALGKQGAIIIFDKGLPQNVMGYAGNAEITAAFEKEKLAMKADAAHFVISDNLTADLNKRGVNQEELSGDGLSFIRKKQAGKTVYFISNLSNKFSEGWLSLSAGDAAHMEGYDPLANQHFQFAERKYQGKTQLYLSLPPGKSCFAIETEKIDAALPTDAAKPYAAYKIAGDAWQLQFNGGRPDYHKTFKLDSLQSWTGLSDTAAFFSGTAKYKGIIKIGADIAAKKDVLLDLGNVNESAEVWINGVNMGKAWCIPFRLKIPSGLLKAGDNRIELAVTNLSANYMRVYDKQHPEWKKFYDANIVDVTYQPFNAAKWTIMPSGLSSNSLRLLYR